MANKYYKDKTRQKIKARKKQLPPTTPGSELAETDRIVEEASARMARKISERTGKEYRTIKSPPAESMSDVLLKFAEPFFDAVDYGDKQIFENIIKKSMMFWNYAIILDRGDTETVKEMKRLFKDDGLEEIASFMLERKQRLFPNNTRLMIDYELNRTKDGGFHVTVSSSLG